MYHKPKAFFSSSLSFLPSIVLISVLLLQLQLLLQSSSVYAKKSIPSTNQQSYLYSTPSTIWNPSPNINEDGFLIHQYKRIVGEWEVDANIGGKYGHKSNQSKNLENVPVIIRQVPGDGNCLFHSLSVALNFVERKKHLHIRNNKAISITRGGNNDNDNNSNNNSSSRRNRRKINNKQRNSIHHDEHNEEEDIHKLYERSSMLRQIAVEMLSPKSSNNNNQIEIIEKGDQQQQQQQQQNHHTQKIKQHHPKITKRHQRKRNLFLQGSEYLHRDELLQIAASQYDLTGYEYCELMKNDGVWGGGPEIVALCNYLKRPIHVYELISIRPSSSHGVSSSTKERRRRDNNNDQQSRKKQHRTKTTKKQLTTKPEFRLRRMACFGSPKFDYKEPLHILSADCRFPDLKPGQEASNGNHFLAMFPIKKGDVMNDMSLRKSSQFASSTKRLGFKVRSGATSNTDMDDEKRSKKCRSTNSSQQHPVRNIEFQQLWNTIRNIVATNQDLSANDKKKRSIFRKHSFQHPPYSTDDRATTTAIGDLLKKPYMSLMDHWVKIVASNTS